MAQTVSEKGALSTRERETLSLMMQGLSNKQIADRMGVSDHTAKFHVANACRKMGTTSRVRAAVVFALMEAEALRISAGASAGLVG